MSTPPGTRPAPPRLAEALLRRVLPRGPVGLSMLGDLRQELEERHDAARRWPVLWYWAQALLLAFRYTWRRSHPTAAFPVRSRARVLLESAMQDLLGDVRYGARVLVTRPGVSAVIVITMALAIGANALVFSFANLLLIRPLPVTDPDRLVWVYSVDPQRGNDRGSVSMADFLDWRSATTTVDHLAALTEGTFTLTGRGDPVRLAAIQCTASLFDAWGLQPLLGRAVRPGEDELGGDPVVLLSHGYWTREFAADPDVLGTELVLNGTPHTVVGVMGPEIEFGNFALLEIWVPLVLERAPRDARTLAVTGRLKPGRDLERAAAEFVTLGSQLEESYPATNAGWSARLVSFYEAIVGRDTWLVLALLGVVAALVLVVACANIGNLMLARASARVRELAMRFALGASRLRVTRQLVGESLLLGVLGGAAGLVLAWLGLRVIYAVDAEPAFKQLRVDLNMALFVLLLSIGATILFSLAPALFAARADLRQTLHDGGRGATSGRWAARWRSALVVCQLALAVALLFVSGLAIRTAIAVQSVDLGFQPDPVLVLRAEMDETRYKNPDAPWRFFEALARELGPVGSIAALAAADRLPTLESGTAARLVIEGRPEPPPTEVPWAARSIVSEKYLSALGIPLEAGRFFEPGDGPDAPPVAVVNREAARRYWPGASPLGARLEVIGSGSQTPWVEIVGVVGNVQPDDLETTAQPQVYLPMAQAPARELVLLARARSGPPSALADDIRAAVRRMDPNLALYDVEPMGTVLRRALAGFRITSGMFVTFGLVALLLAATGLFGVMSFAVSQRVPEFGTRLALGASARDIRTLVLGHSARLMGLGTAIGLLGGLLLGRSMERALYGIRPTDLPTLAGTMATLLLVGLVASYAPARRAMRVDPMTALRSE